MEDFQWFRCDGEVSAALPRGSSSPSACTSERPPILAAWQELLSQSKPGLMGARLQAKVQRSSESGRYLEEVTKMELQRGFPNT